MTYFSTGEVAKKLNLSLRTLRYYDQIKLVEPALRKDNGKRYYTEEDMILLQKVLLLKSTSMSLEDIKKVLDHITIEKTLMVHQEQLGHEMQQLGQSLRHTNTLINTIKLEGEIQWDQLLPLLSEENISERQLRRKNIMEEVFNEEEQLLLNESLPKMENIPDQMTKWINIIKRIELCLEDGKTPNSPEGKLIAEDALLLSNEIFKGNTELADKFWEVRKSEDTSTDLNLYPINKEIINFAEEAMLHFEENG